MTIYTKRHYTPSISRESDVDEIFLPILFVTKLVCPEEPALQMLLSDESVTRCECFDVEYALKTAFS